MLLKRATLMEQWAEFCSEETPKMPAILSISHSIAA
jgi:hypothetical protein